MRKIAIVLVGSMLASFSFAGGQQEDAMSDSDNFWRAHEGAELDILGFPITYIDGLEGQLDEFEELTGITVNMDLYSEGVAHDRVRAELASGAGTYDIVWVQANWSIPYAEQGWIEPLDPFINDSSLTDDEMLELNDVMDSLLELMRYDGDLYGLPFFAATIMTYYRTDVLDEYDITPEQLDTIQGLVDAAQTIHSDEIAGISLRGDPGESSWHSTVFLKGLGGTYVEDIKEGDYYPTFDTPEVIESTEVYADLLANYSIPGAVNALYDDVVIAMQQGNAAIAIEGAPLGGRILDPDESRVRGDVGFRMVPEGPGGRHPAFTGHGFSINSASSNKEAAWLFLQWSNSFDVTKEIALSSDHIAVHRDSLWEDDDFRDRWNLPGEGDFLGTFQESLAIADPDYRPRLQGWSEVNDVYGNALQSVMLGEENAEEAMERVQSEAVEIMQRHGWIE